MSEDYAQQSRTAARELFGAPRAWEGVMGKQEQDRLVAGLRGSVQQRESACTALHGLAERTHAHTDIGEIRAIADIAVACASPLCEVLCKSAAEVSAAEYVRVAQALMAMCDVDPVRVGSECMKPDRCNIFEYLMSLDSALGVVLSKEPTILTAEDALLIAAAYGPQTMWWVTCNGLSATVQEAGISVMEFLQSHMPSVFLGPPAPEPGPHQTGKPWLPGDDRNLTLVRLYLDMLKAPKKIPNFLLAGILFALSHACLVGSSGRPVVALMALENNAIEVLTDVLRTSAPSGLFGTRGFARGGQEAIQAVKEIVSAAQIVGTDVTAQLLDSGFVELLVTGLRETEQIGADKTNALVTCWSALWLLVVLDGSALTQIENQLRTVASTIRFLADSRVDFARELGFTSGALGTLIAANLFGKDEENTFGLAQADMDHIVPWMAEIINPTDWGYVVPFHPQICRPLLNLCTSDTAKKMLLCRPDFIPLLIEGLLLDPKHPSRKIVDETSKAIVHTDFAHCIQHISLFGPGYEALKANPDVVDALDTTVDKAWTEQATVCARAALKQLVPERHTKAAEIDPDAKHIMMSYQWNSQHIAKKIVADLQSRRYRVWFDLECMKGSLVDAMSEAVEQSDLILYGVSEAYKESAMQEEVKMIPLMMQEGCAYTSVLLLHLLALIDVSRECTRSLHADKAKGWLGLILGQSLWHAFFPSAVDTDDKFTNAMHGLVREVGARGKIKMSEGVPSKPPEAPVLASMPTPEPTPAPTTLVPVTPPRDAVAAVSTPRHGFSPSMASTVAMQQTQHSADSLAMIERLLERQWSMLKEQRDEAKADRAEMEARLDAKDTKVEQMHQDMQVRIDQQHADVVAKLAPTQPAEAISREQVVELAARFTRLRAAELITDDEKAVFEDLLADYVLLLLKAA